MKRHISLFLLVTILAGLLAACGAGGGTGGGAPAGGTAATAAPAAGGGAASGNTIKIVSSFPRTGSSKGQTDTVVNSIKQRLEEDKYQACGGKFTIAYDDMDDATAAAGKWDAAQEASNANKAAADPDVMVYLGTFNSGAAKISIPILGGVNLVMISPANTYPGLTKKAGADVGEPDKYYPSGKRNYSRVVPADDIQGVAASNWAKDLGAKSVYILDDTELYGHGIAQVFETHAKEIGLNVLGHDGIDGKASDYRALAAKIVSANPDAVYYGGITQNNAGQLWKDIRGEGYKGIMIGPDGIKEDAFLKAAGDVAEGTYVTLGGVPYDKLTGKGADWYKNYKAKYNAEPEGYAVYGYEAANVALAAINKVCEKDRAKILDAVFATKDFDGALGKWSFDQNGDTSLLGMSGYQVKSGKFEFVKELK
jgi:branched-chain amino acid transport system substrate-binding protein